MRIAVRADGRPDIGIGHIERCLALSQQLRRDKVEIFFIIKQNQIVSEKILKEGFSVLELLPDLSLNKDLRQVLHWLKTKDVPIVITDSYTVDERYLNELTKVAKLITIDDLAMFPFPSDIVISQNIQAKKLPYHSSTGETKFLLGPEFALLRSEYSNLGNREIKLQVQKILVTLGGADFFNLTPWVLRILDKIDQDFSITLMTGVFFNNHREIMKIVRTMRKRIKLISFADKFHEILLQHDLAITGGGTTTYALAATGTPAMSFCLANNQEQNVRDFADYGSLVNLGWGNQISETELKYSTEKLMDDFHLRQKMAKLGQALVDGKGVKRVYSIIRNKN